MKLKKLLSAIPFYNGNRFDEDLEIVDIEMDSRKVKPGFLFVCISGFTVDGHQYADEAVKNGAVAIIAEKHIEAKVPVIIVNDTSRTLAILANKFYDFPTSNIPLIGVTGTNGKTTVTYLLEKIFNDNKEKTGIIGTIQMKIGGDTYSTPNTTPNALDLQRFFKKMSDEQVEQGIMEVSSHALDLGRVYGCDYDVAIFTNLSQDHLDYHKDLDDYLRAKSLLFSQLGNNYNQDKQKFAVINADDTSSDLLMRSTAQHTLTYGCQKKADISAENIKLDASGTSFMLVTPIGSLHIHSKLIGMFNIYNMLAASAAAIARGVSLEVIKSALESIKGVNGRFEAVDVGQDYTVIVDYAHTPDSLENVLQTVKEFAENDIYVVVGCGGDRDRTKRPLMAQIAQKYTDLAILTSDNPRTEDPMAILEDMVEGLVEANDYEVIADRKEAIQKAIHYAKKDDIILIAGKGHETYQQIGHVKYDFDDREIAKKAMKAKGK
ncbi:UDP-N-acetylmuramoyl-L-alanyl-D-glutamate--2,6-diaminopimelate ligase [Oceanobacillus halophilus]|uniref:UDP-N-acetylmuramoyl-L-alanyl-D-glutamate--2,6-diaminopimelate ligase n=1 Tax=Oceanobacillus halophilus TaxID=930130 RepID=A0A495ABL2_9BACI|nr:UDP-N-acetylmuramoyl-L-alanyl-D-glutamate--2,6-diaminopimelate ligase [Oceanobacillus halophilus]RKQ37396.1 UDP-N-acetylmuramoyl-L-alanyl-D-glutamate--2,6-diaminopimelate ligase [Oceanobacillus halophilus]